MKCILMGLLTAIALYVPLGIWCARGLPTVDDLMGAGTHCPDGVRATHSVAFVLAIDLSTVAQENMDGSWSIHPLGTAVAAAYAAVLPGAFNAGWWPVRILLAAPFLRHASFDRAEQINTNPKLWRCDAAA